MNDQFWQAPEEPVDVDLVEGSSDAERKDKKPVIPKLLPLLPVPDMSMFPRMVLPLLITDSRHSDMIDQVLTGDKMMCLVAIKGDHKSAEVNQINQIHQVGVAVVVLRMSKSEGEGIRLIAQGLSRVRIDDLAHTDPFLVARVERLDDVFEPDMEGMALVSNLRGQFHKVLQLSPHLPDELGTLAQSVDDPGALCDLITSTLNISPDERQSIVEAVEVMERLRRVATLLNREIQILELGRDIQKQVKDGLDKTQKDYYLRQQMKAIQKELGEDEDSSSPEVAEYRQKLAEKNLPEQAKSEAERELSRMARMNPASSEYHVISSYLDWMVSLPWQEYTTDQLDINEAHNILEADHFGLEKIKRRILEYLSVRKLNPGMKGPILCFAGPPGVGKTSLGRSIARALGRKFVRISLGGVRDEAEIRGHRRTYVGAMPGRVIQSLRRAGSANPVFMLDEIDKLGNDFRGDPSSALLEVLDPEQNNSFSDHYLDVAFDLSKVVFVCTANMLETIPPPLRDRMEVLELAGYTAEEKLNIAKRYLVPRQRKEHGLDAKQLTVSDAALMDLIHGYTREAGVRNLEREVGSLCRWSARRIAEGSVESVRIGRKDVVEILGKRRFVAEVALRTTVPGVATGMAWTPVGGDILFVEATSMPGKGRLTLTGQLGDVMKESAQAAMSYVRAQAEKLKVDPLFNEKLDLHLHVPAGAIPKDGPSAGVTMFTALLSLLTDRPVRNDLSMTGEITLRGMVLPVGGIKEKVLAAHRAGIREVILPAQNERDLDDVPDSVKKEMNFMFAQRMDQVARWALSGKKHAEPKGVEEHKESAKKTRKASGKANS